MTVVRTAFPLRLRSPRLRELVREVAEREHLSQNDLIEQAVTNEVVARGAMIADDLAAAADRLARLTSDQYDELVSRAIGAVGQGEGQAEPLQARALHTPATVPAHRPRRRAALPRPAAATDPFGVLAAFDAGRG